MARLRALRPALFLLLLLVAVPGSQAADSSEKLQRKSKVSAGLWEWIGVLRLDNLRSAVGALFGADANPDTPAADLGPDMDPDGANGDLGPDMDPNG